MNTVECKKVETFESFAMKGAVYRCALLSIAMCILVKICYCSVSLDGDSILSLMVSDYWNIGKELLNGDILYRDVIDHKGWYLYLIYEFFVAISNNDIRVLIPTETILYVLTIATYYWYTKEVVIGDKSPSSKISAILPTAIFSVLYLLLTMTNVAFVNTEGLSIILLIATYGIVKKKDGVTPLSFLLIGIALGILFNFKITAIAPYFPIFVYACTKHILSKKSIKTLAMSIGFGMLGFVSINIPFVIYLTKNDIWSDFIQVYTYACSARGNDTVKNVFLSIVFLFFAMYYLLKKKERHLFNLLCLSILSMSFAFGNQSTYYMVFYMVVLFLEIFPYKEINWIFATIVLLIFTIVSCNTFNQGLNYRENIHLKTTAENYHITNKNVLYLSEDNGYGVYSDDTYVEPLQWAPEGMFGSDEFTEYYIDLTIKRLESKQFEYVFAYPMPTLEKLEEVGMEYFSNEDVYVQNQQKMFLAIKPYLDKNYTPLETENGWLYKAKTK